VGRQFRLRDVCAVCLFFGGIVPQLQPYA
jgi:hypothetical protein